MGHGWLEEGGRMVLVGSLSRDWDRGCFPESVGMNEGCEGWTSWQGGRWASLSSSAGAGMEIPRGSFEESSWQGAKNLPLEAHHA